MTWDLDKLLQNSGSLCSCGKKHSCDLKEVMVKPQALAELPDAVRRSGGSRVFIIADRNTFQAAGETVCARLEEAGIGHKCFVFPDQELKLNNTAVGEVILNFDQSCDMILAVGSGTIGDLSKLAASVAKRPLVTVATAPSMDGFASATSSVILNGTKVSLASCAPVVIVADLDILCAAPFSLLQAGIGDMLAKYISICEWRISSLVTGEYYCEEIASLMRAAVEDCVAQAEGLRDRRPEAVETVFKSLVMSGMAMSFAGLSRPASGVEHYFAHLWDMRALEFATPVQHHGIQCGVATLFSLKLYDLIKKITPDRTRALAYVESFSLEDWNRQLTEFLGVSAKALIEREKSEGKYERKGHGQRLERIMHSWGQILQIISEELPKEEDLRQVLRTMELPLTPQEIGMTSEEVKETFLATKDIRDKYIASMLVWDLGVIESIAADFQSAL